MPVLGIGTDILRISRFRSIIERSGGLLSPALLKLATRILNNNMANKHNELVKFQHFQRRSDIEGAVKLLSNSWCTKEAVYKSLSSDAQSKFRMRDWYKYNTETGQPEIRNDQYIKQYPHEEFLLTVSHDSDTLISTVLRQSH